MPKVRLQRDQLWDGVIYPAGDRIVPEELAIALGYPVSEDNASEPDEPTVIEPPVNSAVGSTVLQILNSQDADLIAELPTIGQRLAAQIVERMPPGGYPSIQACQETNSSRIDWDKVKEFDHV